MQKKSNLDKDIIFNENQTFIFHKFYFNIITPLWGKLFTKNREAYSYLPASVDAFPSGQEFVDILEKLNYKSVRCIPFTFGVCSAYIGEK